MKTDQHRPEPFSDSRPDSVSGSASTRSAGTRESVGKVGFISFIVPEFSKAFKLSMPEAYQYLKKYGAWDYLVENWWALHTDNPFWTVRHLYDVCLRNGGMR